MKKIMFALALVCSTPAFAESYNFSPVSMERINEVVQTSKKVCPVAAEAALNSSISSEEIAKMMLAAAERAGYTDSEKLLMVGLCTMYTQGMVEGIKLERTR